MKLNRPRIRFNRQERRALEAHGYSRRDLTALRKRILKSEPSPDLDPKALNAKELVGLAIHRSFYEAVRAA